LYLDNGCETPDMKWIDLELKKTRLAMRDLANVVARQELLKIGLKKSPTEIQFF